MEDEILGNLSLLLVRLLFVGVLVLGAWSMHAPMESSADRGPARVDHSPATLQGTLLPVHGEIMPLHAATEDSSD
jgi:hypothetical protein